ncbi:MAG: hypothetical protein K0R41_2377 [Geminicoccaceae bacterium]|jgi:hypothetical protein|nr:hypothetical protein [Geminicoccaceae bacterium]
MAGRHQRHTIDKLVEQRPEHVDAKSRREQRRRRVRGPRAGPATRDEHQPPPEQPLGDPR